MISPVTKHRNKYTPAARDINDALSANDHTADCLILGLPIYKIISAVVHCGVLSQTNTATLKTATFSTVSV